MVVVKGRISVKVKQALDRILTVLGDLGIFVRCDDTATQRKVGGKILRLFYFLF